MIPRRVIYAAMAVSGALVAAATAWLFSPRAAAAAGWTTAAGLFDVLIVASVGRMSAAQTREHALAATPGRKIADVLLLIGTVLALAAVAVLVVDSHSAESFGRRLSYAVLALSCVTASWVLIQLVFALRYAAAYFERPEGGIGFNMSDTPRFVDFAYMSFSLGMTYQVSDTSFETSALRAVALRHSLLAYLFGVVIIATTLNVVLNLAS